MHKKEVIAYDGQLVIYHYFHPLATLPEPELENPSILVRIALVHQDLLQTLRVLGQGAQCCQEPAVSCYSLVDVKSACTFQNEVRGVEG